MPLWIVALLLVTPPQSPAKSPVPSAAVVVPGEECPALILSRTGGLGSEGKGGVVVAVWFSGVILRAESPSRPSGPHIVGRLAPAGVADLLNRASDSRVWNLRSGGVALDSPMDELLLLRGKDRIGWVETPGFNSTSELDRLRQQLFAVAIEQSRRIEGAIDGHWKCPATTWVR